MTDVPQSTVLPTAAVRELDRKAIEELGIPGLILMENAGLRCADRIAGLLGAGRGDGAWIVCGKGNNAGDGFVIARQLLQKGLPCHLSLLCEASEFPSGGDAGLNLAAARAWDASMSFDAERSPSEVLTTLPFSSPIIVDAILGTGVRGEVREPFARWIRGLEALERPRFAVDLPSGLDADSGEILGCALRADWTASFVAAKPGFFRGSGPDYVGELEVVDITIPRRLVDEAAATAD